jgi:hypothetical protein
MIEASHVEQIGGGERDWEGALCHISAIFGALCALTLENPRKDEIEQVFSLAKLGYEFVEGLLNDD